MLEATIADAAVAVAKRRSHAEVTKAHVLAALLTCSAVTWPDDERPEVAIDKLVGPSGTAVESPKVGDDIAALIARCGSASAAREVAVELIAEFGIESSGSQQQHSNKGHTAVTDEAAEELGLVTASLVVPTDVLARVEALVNQLDPTPVLLHGRLGSGRTSFLRLLAERLKAGSTSRNVRMVAARELLTNPDSTLSLGRGKSPRDVVLIDDADLVLGLGQQSFSTASIGVGALLAGDGPAVVLAIPTSLRKRYEMSFGRLADRSVAVELPPLAGSDLERAIESATSRLSTHHGVTFEEGALRAAASAPSHGDSRAHPGLAASRLDIAAASVAARGSSTVTADDVILGAGASLSRARIENLRGRLGQAVLGQEHAVSQLAARLMLTGAGLDLRPERPDGVFLFVGPTGVGKTALARALALEMFGSEDNLIRFDMSEYSGEWATSRLIGPPPGYTGSTEPESWLTTKVRNKPNAVVLLDEIEKAHPGVWNVFLQVFDAGRLTDGRGEVADFSSVVVIMTSNLGAGSTERKAVGFTGGSDTREASERRVLEVVAESMRPELLNRIDGTVVFHPLERTTIHEIARAEIGRLTTSLGERGYLIEVDGDVVDLVASDGYDERYGARHVQRAIERLLLEPLVEKGAGKWRAQIDAGAVAWVAAD